MRLRVLAAVCGAAAAACLLAPAAASADTPWQVGASKVDTTPPLCVASDNPSNPAGAGTCAMDDQLFPISSCPTRPVLTGTRRFVFEEPYQDVPGGITGEFNYTPGQGPNQGPVPEPFCDANGNGRYDGMYLSSGVDNLALRVHDPIDARAMAISNGETDVVLVSAAAQGIFENYIRGPRPGQEALGEPGMLQKTKQLEPAIDEMLVSSNHNESSPDTVGIYGAPGLPPDSFGSVAGANSGINEYYMDWLIERVAEASNDAYDSRVPASLRAAKVPLPSTVRVRLSENFPTTDDTRDPAETVFPAAIDPRLRILQARDAGGDPIFTMMNLAAHNQQIGHTGATERDISSDWPGFFHNKLEQLTGGGMAVFLAGANGSEEDPETVPKNTSSYAQAQEVGEALATAVNSDLSQAEDIAPGQIVLDRKELFAPLENEVFAAAEANGLFGERQGYTGGVPSGRSGSELRTFASVLDIGPDLQFLGNPGEAFPALTHGSPWGIDDAGCPNRPNPAVPTWHARGKYRFQAGLADDLIGYEIPAWAFSTFPPAGITTPMDGPSPCFNDSDDRDPKGHKHKLELEGVGPTASNMVADNLADLADKRPDPAAEIGQGRFVCADGELSRWPSGPEVDPICAGGAVAVWLAEKGSSALTPGEGTIVALDGTNSFGSRAVDCAGDFMDYDGTRQAGGPDITTRGMVVRDPGGDVIGRFYVNVYPHLTGAAALDPSSATGAPTGEGCRVLAEDTGGGTGGSGGSAGSSGQAGSQPGGGSQGCRDDLAPTSRFIKKDAHVSRSRITLEGTATDRDCVQTSRRARQSGKVTKVYVTVARREGRRCRFLGRNGKLGKKRRCRRPVLLAADGTDRWRFQIKTRLEAGRYRATVRAHDANGNRERPGRRNRLGFKIR